MIAKFQSYLLLIFALLFFMFILPACAENYTASTTDELFTAVDLSNLNNEADTITLVGNPNLLLPAPLLISGELTITGPGTLSGTNIDILLSVIGGTATLNTLTIQDCITYGGAIFVSGGALSVIDCLFQDNIGTAIDAYYSGAIIASDANITLPNSNFIGNSTVASAGAIIMQNGSLTASGCTFTGNIAPFENTWGGFGGVITTMDCPVTLTDSTFTSNTSNSMGGAVSCLYGHLSLDGCTFTNNRAYFMGGAVAAISPGFDVSGCTFTGNESMIGGAILYQSTYDEYGSDYLMMLSDCDFFNNIAEGKVLPGSNESLSGGGAIASLGDIAALNCRFTNNRVRSILTADDINVEAVGGAILMSAARFENANCVFSANSVVSVNNSSTGSANAIGGAIGTFGDWYYEMFSLNSTFSGNSVTASAPNSGMADTTGGGIALASSYVLLFNSIFWGNMADGIPNQLSYISGDFSAPTLSYCDIQGGVGVWGGIGNIDADPKFTRNPGAGIDGIWGTADDDAGDLTLTASSPCINAGSNDNIDTEIIPTDLAGNPRIVNDIVDIGAYEYQAGTAEDLIMNLQESVQLVANSGAVLPANGQSLQAKLLSALAYLAAGDLVKARECIIAFMNQVNAFVKTDRLTQVQADELLAKADAILAMLL